MVIQTRVSVERASPQSSACGAGSVACTALCRPVMGEAATERQRLDCSSVYPRVLACLCLLLWYKSVSVGLWARLACLARLQQHGWIHLLLPALCVAERIRPEPGVGTAVACGKCMAMHSHLHCVVWVRALLEPCSARACNAPTLAVAVGAGGRFCQADPTSL